MATKIKLKRGLEENLPELEVGEPGFTTDSKKLFVGSDAGNIEIGALIEVTWQELKDKRDAGLLTAGAQYRITDYMTTTVQEDTRSAGHQFDIIVIADDVNKLNENARAVQHEGDTYFANSKLEAWKLVYCLDNDTSRFAWADDVNGKGVIYRMIDEFNNDCPYDFKNIQFKRYAIVSVSRPEQEHFIIDNVSNSQGIYYGAKNVYGDPMIQDASYGDYTWCWTFSTQRFYYDESLEKEVYDEIEDGSNLSPNGFYNDEGQLAGVLDNIIKPYIRSYSTSETSPNLEGRQWLNNIVMMGNYDGVDLYRYESFHNTFGDNCRDSTFGSSCYSNIFGNDCYANTFGYNCNSNTFGNNCNSNTFGNTCYSNTFGYNCNSNTFGAYCYYNTFGNYCFYLLISDASSTQKRYISVDSGVRGASIANQFELYDPAILDKDYQVTFKKSASGKYLMLWATDTGTMTGKVKDSVLDNTWEDIV